MCNTCLQAADFNGDGKIDILYAFFVGEEPSAGVLLGNGDGTFRPGFSFSDGYYDIVGGHGRDAALLADLNGDGKPDLVSFNGGYALVHLGVGDGTFTGPFIVSACAVAPVAADVNGDGKQDLLCGASVLLSNGDGTFRAGPSTLDGNAVLAADFNGDGHVDIVFTTASGLLALVPGHGDGTFGPEIPINFQLDPQTLKAGDFNGDGLLDLVGASQDGTEIAVLPGLGDGTFGAPIFTAGVPGPITVAADFNGDGKLDLVAGDAVLLGNGDGTFRFPVFVGVVPEACNPQYYLTGGYACDYMHLATAAADFNGDGSPDLASGFLIQIGTMQRTEADVAAMLNDSPGNGFTATGVSAASWTWPVAPGSIVSAYGVDLAPQTETAGAGPLPTTLGGIRLHVQDRSHTGDSLAPLLYVSSTQINYILQSTDPFAWVSIERVGSPYVPQGMAVPIAPIAPGLFTEGGGLAAATAVSFDANGVPTPVTVIECTGTICSSVPIDVSGAPVYLSLYGTGFDAASTATSSCTIAGQILPATYAGPQEQFAGLDQINVLLPKSLAGAGTVSVTCHSEPRR